MEALNCGVWLDGENPMARYGLWILWLRRLRGNSQGDRWEDLIRVYLQLDASAAQEYTASVIAPALARFHSKM